MIHAGDIGTVAKLTVTATGDTFCDKNHPLNDPAAQVSSCSIPGGHWSEDPGGCRQDQLHARRACAKRT